jgi:nicotinamide-nucleotide amidase
MTPKNIASIITIGDELLIGQVIDTNSAFIAQELNKIGVSIKNRVAVGDNFNDIWQALDEQSKIANFIIITGGLGPTADDITKPLLCQYFNGEMVMHQPTLQHLEYLFKEVLKRPMIDRNTQQALVPNVCNVLLNQVGTAPGMMFTKNETTYFALPGVPSEMKWLMNNCVLDIISKKASAAFILHKTAVTFGLGESFIAEKLIEFEKSLPNNIKLAYLPNNALLRLRLTGQGVDKEILSQQLNNLFNNLIDTLKEHIIYNEDATLEQIVANLLTSKNQTISTAESCTGGYIASLFTKNAGASQYFKGGIVSYSNQMKNSVLQVPTQTLETQGAVSEATVIAMATQCLQLCNTTYSLAVSGIMGPDGGTFEKPVGTVWMAVASQSITKTKKIQLRYNRQKNIEHTCQQVVNMIRELIVDNS